MSTTTVTHSAEPRHTAAHANGKKPGMAGQANGQDFNQALLMAGLGADEEGLVLLPGAENGLAAEPTDADTGIAGVVTGALTNPTSSELGLNAQGKDTSGEEGLAINTTVVDPQALIQMAWDAKGQVATPATGLKQTPAEANTVMSAIPSTQRSDATGDAGPSLISPLIKDALGTAITDVDATATSSVSRPELPTDTPTKPTTGLKKGLPNALANLASKPTNGLALGAGWKMADANTPNPAAANSPLHQLAQLTTAAQTTLNTSPVLMQSPHGLNLPTDPAGAVSAPGLALGEANAALAGASTGASTGDSGTPNDQPKGQGPATITAQATGLALGADMASPQSVFGKALETAAPSHDGAARNLDEAMNSALKDLGAELTVWASQDNPSASLSLDDLGIDGMKVDIQLNGDEAHVHFKTDDEQVRRALEQQAADALKMSLEATGIALGQLLISANPERSAPTPDDTARMAARSRAMQGLGAVERNGEAASTGVNRNLQWTQTDQALDLYA